MKIIIEYMLCYSTAFFLGMSVGVLFTLAALHWNQKPVNK